VTGMYSNQLNYQTSLLFCGAKIQHFFILTIVFLKKYRLFFS
jgi:hypothetical protein